MRNLFASLWCISLIAFHSCQVLQDPTEQITSIAATIFSERNEFTPSLANTNVVLIIRNDANHSDVHHLQLKHDQNTFPIRFHLTDVKEIRVSGAHLLTLLIFGYTHRLLWEGALFRQHLSVDAMNHIGFYVEDVSNLGKCLSHGYPCLEASDPLDPLVSMCCSDTVCQLSANNVFTCGGNVPAVQNVVVTYFLPMSLVPITGLLDEPFLSWTEKLYQSRSAVGTMVKVNKGIIVAQPDNQYDYPFGYNDVRFLLILDLSLISSASCYVCLDETRRLIEERKMPFQIPRPYYCSVLVCIGNPLIIDRGSTSTKALNDITTTIDTTESYSTNSNDAPNTAPFIPFASHITENTIIASDTTTVPSDNFRTTDTTHNFSHDSGNNSTIMTTNTRIYSSTAANLKPGTENAPSTHTMHGTNIATSMLSFVSSMTDTVNTTSIPHIPSIDTTATTNTAKTTSTFPSSTRETAAMTTVANMLSAGTEQQIHATVFTSDMSDAIDSTTVTLTTLSATTSDSTETSPSMNSFPSNTGNTIKTTTIANLPLITTASIAGGFASTLSDSTDALTATTTFTLGTKDANPSTTITSLLDTDATATRTIVTSAPAEKDTTEAITIMNVSGFHTATTETTFTLTPSEGITDTTKTVTITDVSSIDMVATAITLTHVTNDTTSTAATMVTFVSSTSDGMNSATMRDLPRIETTLNPVTVISTSNDIIDASTDVSRIDTAATAIAFTHATNDTNNTATTVETINSSTAAVTNTIGSTIVPSIEISSTAGAFSSSNTNSIDTITTIATLTPSISDGTDSTTIVDKPRVETTLSSITVTSIPTDGAGLITTAATSSASSRSATEIMTITDVSSIDMATSVVAFTHVINDTSDATTTVVTSIPNTAAVTNTISSTIVPSIEISSTAGVFSSTPRNGVGTLVTTATFTSSRSDGTDSATIVDILGVETTLSPTTVISTPIASTGLITSTAPLNGSSTDVTNTIRSTFEPSNDVISSTSINSVTVMTTMATFTFSTSDGAGPTIIESFPSRGSTSTVTTRTTSTSWISQNGKESATTTTIPSGKIGSTGEADNCNGTKKGGNGNNEIYGYAYGRKCH